MLKRQSCCRSSRRQVARTFTFSIWLCDTRVGGCEEGVAIDGRIVAGHSIRNFGGEEEMTVVCEWLQSRWELPKQFSTNCRLKIITIFLIVLLIVFNTFFYLLKPTGYVMHQQFNIQQLYALPTLYLCVLYLSENKQRLVPLTA